LLDAGDKEVIGLFGKAGVKVNEIAPAELAKIQEKVKPVVAKFAPQIGEEFIKEFYAEIDKVRAAK
jgi:TRAP-type transport system periplasmic protein